MNTAALYVRVSTQDQSLDNQLPDLERLAAARRLNVVETFAEKVSAAKARPQLDRLLADAHRGWFQVVIVWSLDRLHRSMLGALQTVLDLDRLGEVVSLREPWLDTGGAVRPLLIAIFGWVAEQLQYRWRRNALTVGGAEFADRPQRRQPVREECRQPEKEWEEEAAALDVSVRRRRHRNSGPPATRPIRRHRQRGLGRSFAGGHSVSGLIRIFGELPGWTFEIDEVSACVFRVKGIDQDGRSVEASGTDPDALLEECRRSAAKMRGGPRR